MRIALLKGGLSSEREVSLRSAVSISKALRTLTNDVVEIDVGFDLAEQLEKAKPDVAFIALKMAAFRGYWNSCRSPIPTHP